jgi:hypothetical protein
MKCTICDSKSEKGRTMCAFHINAILNPVCQVSYCVAISEQGKTMCTKHINEMISPKCSRCKKNVYQGKTLCSDCIKTASDDARFKANMKLFKLAQKK